MESCDWSVEDIVEVSAVCVSKHNMLLELRLDGWLGNKIDAMTDEYQKRMWSQGSRTYDQVSGKRIGVDLLHPRNAMVIGL